MKVFLFPQYRDNDVFFRFPLKSTLVFTHLWSLRPKVQISNSKLQSKNRQITWIYKFKNWNNYVHFVVLEVKQMFHCIAYVKKKREKKKMWFITVYLGTTLLVRLHPSCSYLRRRFKFGDVPNTSP